MKGNSCSMLPSSGENRHYFVNATVATFSLPPHNTNHLQLYYDKLKHTQTPDAVVLSLLHTYVIEIASGVFFHREVTTDIDLKVFITNNKQDMTADDEGHLSNTSSVR